MTKAVVEFEMSFLVAAGIAPEMNFVFVVVEVEVRSALVFAFVVFVFAWLSLRDKAMTHMYARLKLMTHLKLMTVGLSIVDNMTWIVHVEVEAIVREQDMERKGLVTQRLNRNRKK